MVEIRKMKWSLSGLILVLFFQHLSGQFIRLHENSLPVADVFVRLTAQSTGKTYEGLTNEQGLLGFDLSAAATDSIHISSYHLTYNKIDTTLWWDGGTLDLAIERASYDLSAVNFVSERINKQRTVQLNQKDFLRLASSFDDPSRLVSKAPGFSGTNDQNNSLSFRGMPSHYYKWQIEGLDIVNPNHLANAGTLQDLASANGGGVNMVSGQLIRAYKFHLPGSTHAEGSNQMAGISEMDLADSITPFVQASLLGLEAGLGINKGDHHLWANYRYSFTGLLADFGIDFGGEAIKFQDLIANYTYEHENTRLKWFGGWGNNSNIFTAQDSITSFKDLQNIDYRGSTYFTGASFDATFNQGWKMRAGLAYSSKDATRNSEALSLFLDQSAFSMQQELYSANLNFTYKKLGDFGVNFTSSVYDMAYTRSGELSTKNVSYQQRLTTARLYAMQQCRLGHGMEFTTLLPLDLHTASDLTKVFLNPKIQLRKFMRTGFSLTAALYNNSSLLPPPFDLAVSRSFNGEITAEKVFPWGQAGLTAFYHLFQNTHNSLDEIWSYETGLPAINASGKSQGLTFYGSNAIGRGWWYDLNATLMAVKNQDGQSTLGDLGKSLNFQAGKVWPLKRKQRNLAVALAYIARSGQLSYTLDGNFLPDAQPVIAQAKPYYRMDLRINYTTARSVLSVDLQNVFGRVNQGVIYFDPYLQQNAFVNQLGLVPLLTYRYFFGGMRS